MDSSRKIAEALAAIEAHIRDSLTIDKLAGGAYLSKYHYQRIFRKAVGESVMGYVTRRRMELAMAELAETEASVLDIALGLGYGSQEGFSRSLGDARDFFEEMPSPFEPEPYTYTPEAFPLPLFFLEAELQKLSAHLDESNLQKLAGAAKDIRLGKRQAWKVVRDVAEELEGMGAVLLYICDNLDK